MFDDSIDPGILAEFIDESMDSIETLPQLFIQMEKEPQNNEIINAIFRPVHSIKGNSAFFGMLKLKNLTHEMETTLDLCRKHELVPDKRVIDILLKGLDEVIAIFERIRNGEPEVENEEAFIALINEVKSSQETSGSGEIDLAKIAHNISIVLNSGLLEGSEEINILEDSLAQLNQLYCRLDHGSAEDSQSGSLNLYTQILSWLERNNDTDLEGDQCLELTDMIKSLAGHMTNDSAIEIYDKLNEEYDVLIFTVGLDDLLRGLIIEKIEQLQQLQPLDDELADEMKDTAPIEELIPLEENQEEPDEKVEAISAAKEDSGENKSNKTMRVPEDTIDEFLNFVGELVVVREMYDHLRLHFEEEGVKPELTSELRRYTDNFRQVSGELERTCMNIRKQPIKMILQKIPRIVRDVASSCGKKINVEIKGDSISVDKSLIGILEAPLVHMTRNAADHGIETVEERLQAGKDEAGLITINVTEDDEFLFIEISDNGRGLNFEALRHKGISMGVFTEEQNPTEEEIAQIIFQSGVSTAQKVTDISGRGVGMDVVKKYIEGAGGVVQISSATGKGSTFAIQMRKSITTQIIDGLVLKLADTHYVIPLKYVLESFPPEPENFCNVYDKIEHIKRHELLLPVVRLSEIFNGVTESHRERDKGILIVVDYNGTKIALLADEITNIQQVVLKPLKGLHMNKALFTGGALRGDGYISLILNIEQLVNERAELLETSEQTV